MYLENRSDVDPTSIWLLAHEVPFQSPPPFWVKQIGRFTVHKGYDSTHVDKDGYLLMYTLRGTGQLVYEGKTYNLNEGSIAFLDRTKLHRYYISSGQTDWTFYWVHISEPNCAFFYDSMCKNGFHVLHCGGALDIEPPLRRIMELFENPQAVTYSQISHNISEVLSSLLAFYTDQQRRNTLHLQAIEETVRFIRSNYRDAIDVDLLAEKAQLSKYYYIKLFKEIMHATPYEYLLGVRINEAKKLLLSTDHRSAEIGTLVGFADECNFSRTFKRLTGITPIQYRKNS